MVLFVFEYFILYLAPFCAPVALNELLALFELICGDGERPRAPARVRVISRLGIVVVVVVVVVVVIVIRLS